MEWRHSIDIYLYNNFSIRSKSNEEKNFILNTWWKWKRNKNYAKKYNIPKTTYVSYSGLVNGFFLWEYFTNWFLGNFQLIRNWNDSHSGFSMCCFVWNQTRKKFIRLFLKNFYMFRYCNKTQEITLNNIRWCIIKKREEQEVEAFEECFLVSVEEYCKIIIFL